MLQELDKEVRGCLVRAEECARKAEMAITTELRDDFLRLQRQWLDLAKNYEFAELLNNLPNENAAEEIHRIGDATKH
jgi:hypothetical protein